MSLDTHEVVVLKVAMETPGVAPGQLFTPETGVVSLEDGTTTPSRAFHRHSWQARTAPPAIAGDVIAITTALNMDATRLGENVVRRFGPDASVPPPMGWYPPAIGGQQIAWVADAGPDGADVWWVPVGKGHAEPLATGPGQQHHVAGHDRWLAWASPDEVVIFDTVTGERTTHPTQTGFSAGLTLWRDVACWETRDGASVDIACSDGVRIEGEGHQRWPSRWEDHLLYRDGEQLMLWTRQPPLTQTQVVSASDEAP